MDKKNKKSLTEDSDPIDQPFTRLMASRRQCSSSSDSLISSTSTISVNSLQSIDSKIKFEELNQDEAKPKKRKKSSQPEVSTTSSILINDSSQGNSSNKSNTNIVAEGMAKKTTNLNKSSSFDNKIRSNDNQINISIKKLSIGNDNSIFKVPYGVHPWGTLCFYENKNLKFKRELYNIDEIKISNQTIFETSGNKSSPNYNINYTDWHFVLGNGFSLRKKTENEKSVIYFKNLDEKNKYRLFVNNEIVEINSC
jgi:hypothetical protein